MFLWRNEKKYIPELSSILLLNKSSGLVVCVTLCMLGNFVCFFVVCGFFFLINFFKIINLSGIPSECQTVWILIRHDVSSGLIWVQIVCKGYQKMTEVATSGERVYNIHFSTVILSLPLIQEEQLSVSGKRMCTSTG